MCPDLHGVGAHQSLHRTRNGSDVLHRLVNPERRDPRRVPMATQVDAQHAEVLLQAELNIIEV